MMRLIQIACLLMVAQFSFGDIREEIAHDLKRCRISAEGYKVDCTISCMAALNSGTYTAGFHRSARYLKRTQLLQSKNGNWDRQTDGYLESNGQVYSFRYAEDYPNHPGTGGIERNGFDKVASLLQAFGDQGLVYDDLVTDAEEIKLVGNEVEVTGRADGKSYRLKIARMKAGWRVMKSNMWFQKSNVDLVSEVHLADWTRIGQIELPLSGSGIVKGAAPTPIRMIPTTFVTDPLSVKPSTPLNLTDVYRPFTVVVAGPNQTLQMTAKGQLVESSGLLKSETSPWAWLYMSSVAGVVFFVAILVSQKRARWSKKRRRSGPLF